MKKTILFKKHIIILILGLLLVLQSTVNATESNIVATIGENTYTSLEEAITNSISGDTILVNAENVSLSQKVTITDKAIIIDFNNNKLSRNGYTGNLFTVSANSKLVVKNVIVDGGAKWSIDEEKFNELLTNYIESGERFDGVNYPTKFESGVYSTDNLFTNNGTLIIENASISGFYTKSAKSVVSAGANTITEIINTTITNCASHSGGCIINTSSTSPKVILSGDTIEYNFTGSNGGMLKLYGAKNAPANVYVINTSISYNKGVNSNGIVAMMYNGNLFFESGKINDNIGISGKQNGRNAPIYIHGDNGGIYSKFVMNGGEIKQNRGTSASAIDTSKASSSMELNAGIIEGNVTTVDSSENSIQSACEIKIGEEMQVIGDISATNNLTNDGLISGDITFKNYTITNNGTINGNIVITAPSTVTSEDILLDNSGDINGIVTIKVPAESGLTEIKNELVSGTESITAPVRYNYIESGAEKYVITFEYGNGVDKDGYWGRTVVVEENWTAIPLIANSGEYLSKEHYIFTGFYTDKELTKFWNYTDEVTSNITVYLGWEAKEYELKYIVDGKVNTKMIKYGETINLKNPTKSGYKFIGWSPELPNTMPAGFETEAMFKVRPLKITYYTLSFETNGGSEIEEIKEQSSSKINLIKYIPKKEGYTFDGWYLDKDFKEKCTSIKLKNNTKIYAKWKIENPYVDIYEDDYYYNEALYMYENKYIIGFEDNTFGPSSSTTRAMIVMILWNIEGTPKGYEESFLDVSEDSWYHDAIAWGEKVGIIKGYDNEHFGPEDYITREQLATIMMRYAEYKECDVVVVDNDTIEKFNDFEYINEYALDALKWCTNEKLILGYEDNYLRPSNHATRAQTACVFYRLLNEIIKIK